MVRKNVGTILGYDLHAKRANKDLEVLMIYAPATTGQYTIDLRLRAFGADGQEFLYAVDKQCIQAEAKNIKKHCDFLFTALLKQPTFWEHVNNFLEAI